MNDQEQLMDNLLNVDLEIIDVVRELYRENWDSFTLKQQIVDLLKIRDEMVQQLMLSKDDNHNCDYGQNH
ncbi:MAG: hypothetical protein OEL56_04270 [Nitrosopumilus sp.]|nr:hypothetical protein [Nitrosopumilus sp.]MDH3515862.1 hypothetical protein [Nitrosopumilus sp.]MDH3564786.1 hypothetical protein [Nitrosopumilus sp.]MDH5418703.1 hypothetical protein [Nitrosopumilus sp.]MDH5555255.1 hypothetical protein [Nitrosopumilus sp.]